MITVVSLAVSVLAVLAVRVVTAQDTAQGKYTVRVPNGLAFAEFRGYEGWQTVSISQNEKLVAVILANPVMIDAYQAALTGNGQPFPGRLQDGEDPLEPEKDGDVPRGRQSRGACMTPTSW